MSKNILKALMQLFAIIARHESNAKDRRNIVSSFLQQLLNQELVNEYLQVFDEYYSLYQKKQSSKKINKTIAVSSVKVLKICIAINEELTLQQKIVVLIRLFEFIKSDNVVTDQELEFVSTVADTFNISEGEYTRIKAFVVYSFDEIPNSTKVLLIDDNQDHEHAKVKHILTESLKGQIRILNITTANIYVVRYLGDDEIYLNGQLLEQDKVFVLTSGTSIRNSKIKPIYYSDIVSRFNVDKMQSKIVFNVQDVEYKFKGGEVGLHDINFTEESGKLVGIMGASGAGKSTLLNVLNGSNPPTGGKVLINNIDIHFEKEQIEGVIGHVSQDDLLIEELTVFQNLYYNAKLCFDNLSEFQIIRTVLKLLKSLGLFEKKDMKVGSPLNKKISGGQRKRLNIALELIREPSVLFLDEPTSGLSSRDSENIMDLLKELALKGKLVFVVIHQPSSDIFKMFDKLIILDTGGYQIYNGDPVDSIIYFKSRMHQADWSDSECTACGNVNPEQVFNIVESRVLDEFGNVTHLRKKSPVEWSNHFEDYKKTKKEKKIKIPSILPEIFFKTPSKFKQFLVFVKRDVLSKLTNTQYLFINLLEAPILAFALSYIIKYYNVNATNTNGYIFSENSNMPVYIFMSVIIAIFMGLTVSAEEIIRDRLILKRESFLNLSRASYLFSKVSILLTLSAIQAISFIVIGNLIMEIQGMWFHYWLILFSSFSFANLLGLNVSDGFKTAVTIYILIPFLVIPQMILSGIIVKYDKINPDISSPSSIPWYGEIITARWAYEALAVHQFKNNEFEKIFYSTKKSKLDADYKKNYWLRILKNKLIDVNRDLDNLEKRDKVINSFELLRNEIEKELKFNKTYGTSYIDSLGFNVVDSLYIDKFSDSVFSYTKDYFKILNNQYMTIQNNAISEENKLTKKYEQLTTKEKEGLSAELIKEKSNQKKEDFLELKRRHYNKDLSELVTNYNDIEKIVEYKNRLYRKMDPIYQYPESNLIKAHFYAPKKQIFGVYFDTYWVNVTVIWLMIVLLYITLYYKALKKLLCAMENFSDRFKKNKE